MARVFQLLATGSYLDKYTNGGKVCCSPLKAVRFRRFTLSAQRPLFYRFYASRATSTAGTFGSMRGRARSAGAARRRTSLRTQTLCLRL